MIIQENVIININNSNKKIYSSKGYKWNDDNKCLINIKDLSNNSHYLIKVKCDNCGCIKESIYKNYFKITNGLTENYYCDNCKHLKIKNTNILKYGVKSSFERTDTKIKIKNKLIERYGVDSPLKSSLIKDKMINNLLQKYNVSNISKIEEIKLKKINQLKKTWIDRLSKNYNNLNIIDGDYDNKNLKINCDLNKNHIFDINLNLLHNRIEFGNVLCTICNPINSNRSSYEDIIYEYIKTIYNDEILLNNRNIIKPYEIDIFIPKLNIGFDINGLHWHNELKKDKNYHKLKTDISLKNDIQLIQFYEDDIRFKLNIVKSIIKNKLKLIKNKIYARKTEIKEISDNKLVKDFLNINHIQGFVNSNIKLGLFYDDELVSLMTFGKLRKPLNCKSVNDNEYEMLRFCNKLNTNVIGGASKLFKYFLKQYKPSKVTSYADRSYSNGNLYKQLQFKMVHITKPNYFYIINGMRKHRFGFRKDILIKQGFNKNITEHQIMLNRKIYKIYDSGNIKFEYIIDNL